MRLSYNEKDEGIRSHFFQVDWTVTLMWTGHVGYVVVVVEAAAMEETLTNIFSLLEIPRQYFDTYTYIMYY